MVRNCESAGHGLGSRHPGEVDPGAVGSGTTEAALTKSFARHMAENGAAMKIPTLFRDKGPYYLADDQAKAFKASRFREWHFDSAGKTATGCTVLIGPNASEFEKKWAYELSVAISKTLGIRNRGVVVRKDLAVLKQYKDMASVLVEIGFISNRGDITRFINRRVDLEIAVVNVDRKMSNLKPIKTLPRTSKNRVNIPKYMKVA